MGGESLEPDLPLASELVELSSDCFARSVAPSIDGDLMDGGCLKSPVYRVMLAYSSISRRREILCNKVQPRLSSRLPTSSSRRQEEGDMLRD